MAPKRASGGQGASSSAAPLQPTSAAGTSEDWILGQNNQLRIGTEFLQHLHSSNAEYSKVVGIEWGGVPEENAASHHFWELLATFLLDVYVIPPGCRNAGKGLGNRSACNAWGGLFNQMRERFPDRVCARPACGGRTSPFAPAALTATTLPATLSLRRRSLRALR